MNKHLMFLWHIQVHIYILKSASSSNSSKKGHHYLNLDWNSILKIMTNMITITMTSNILHE